jgi:hypothetical protein
MVGLSDSQYCITQEKIVDWCSGTSVILALGRLRQENHELEASLDYIVKPYLERKERRKRRGGEGKGREGKKNKGRVFTLFIRSTNVCILGVRERGKRIKVCNIYIYFFQRQHKEPHKTLFEKRERRKMEMGV